MPTATTPEVPQHMAALERANEIRLARADLKRKLASGEVKVERIILDPPECAASARVNEILRALPRTGHSRTAKIIGRCSFSDQRRLRDLTERQRDELVEVLRKR